MYIYIYCNYIITYYYEVTETFFFYFIYIWELKIFGALLQFL